MSVSSLLAAATRIIGLRLAPPLRPRRAEVRAAPLDEAPLDVLAAKVLYSHIRNKQQLLGPPPTALGHVDQHQAELLIRAAVTAAVADGQLGEEEERRLKRSLATLEAQAGEPNFIAVALKRPLPLESLLLNVRDAHMASLFYAASLMALDSHRATNRAYLRYLALRLRLPETELERLHNQYGIDIGRVSVDA